MLSADELDQHARNMLYQADDPGRSAFEAVHPLLEQERVELRETCIPNPGPRRGWSRSITSLATGIPSKSLDFLFES